MVRGPAMLLPNPVDEVHRAPRALRARVRDVVPGQRARRSRTTASSASSRTAPRAAPARSPRARSRSRSPGAPRPRSRPRWGRPRAHPPPPRPAPSSIGRTRSRSRARSCSTPSTRACPALDVWVGYAVLVVDKQGRRRVEQGPKNLLLEYDETLEVLQLSTGTPKTDDRLAETVFLRVAQQQGQRRLRRRDRRITSQVTLALLDARQLRGRAAALVRGRELRQVPLRSRALGAEGRVKKHADRRRSTRSRWSSCATRSSARRDGDDKATARARACGSPRTACASPTSRCSRSGSTTTTSRRCSATRSTRRCRPTSRCSARAAGSR